MRIDLDITDETVINLCRIDIGVFNGTDLDIWLVLKLSASDATNKLAETVEFIARTITALARQMGVPLMACHKGKLHIISNPSTLLTVERKGVFCPIEHLSHEVVFRFLYHSSVQLVDSVRPLPEPWVNCVS